MKQLMSAMILACVATATLAATPGGHGRTNYLLHCSGCHQQDGGGNPENGIPDMKNKVGHFLRDAAGRDFLVQVPGTSQAALNDAQIAELLNWMVYAFSAEQVPADFRPYSTEEVTRLRSRRLDDVPAFRATIVDRLGRLGYRIE
jgi:mono/diheme cytochrome c family protein